MERKRLWNSMAMCVCACVFGRNGWRGLNKVRRNLENFQKIKKVRGVFFRTLEFTYVVRYASLYLLFLIKLSALLCVCVCVCVFVCVLYVCVYVCIIWYLKTNLGFCLGNYVIIFTREFQNVSIWFWREKNRSRDI